MKVGLKPEKLKKLLVTWVAKEGFKILYSYLILR
jgi:hypothetical protein